MQTDPDALIIGAGPAGLMAAEMLATCGARVLVAEAMPSIGRKFLMAGKSGLNLTKDEPLKQFLTAYGTAGATLRPMLEAFGPTDIQNWAEGLGQSLFTGSTGRVFPKSMKASPLLRAWAGRLAAKGVEFRTRWKWHGWAETETVFSTAAGEARLMPRVTVIALGGASWARLGSDGQWAETLAGIGVPLAEFQPANVGLKVDWSNHMRQHFGKPVKGVALCAGSGFSRGEFVISARGLEGGGIYALSAYLRDGTALAADLKPDLQLEALADRLAIGRGKGSMSNHLRKRAGLGAVQLALLNEFGRPLPRDPMVLAHRIKYLQLTHGGPRPLKEAISTAGGIRWEGVDDGLMLKARPGIFAAGEMLDWEAPTGGYLLTGCLATGRWAGLHAREYL